MGNNDSKIIPTDQLIAMINEYNRHLKRHPEPVAAEDCAQTTNHKIANFVFPVIEGLIYVGQRVKPPHPGCFGPVGGRSGSMQENSLWQQPQLMHLPGGLKRISWADYFCKSNGLEYTIDTAVREFCEEIFSDKVFPHDFSSDDVQNSYRFGFIMDNNETAPEIGTYCCYFHIAKIHRTNFSLKLTEISQFKPIVELSAQDVLFPLAKLALEELRALLEQYGGCYSFPYSSKLAEQIPEFDPMGLVRIIKNKFTSMISLATYAIASEALK